LLEDHVWFARLFHEHVELVGRALRAQGVSNADLPDVCQEVFVTAHRLRAQVIPGSSLGAWLYRIAVNAARNHRRTRVRRREDFTDSPIDVASGPEQLGALERKDDLDLALQLLGSLDEEKREIFLLHDVEELEMKEITSAIGIPLKTGYSRLRAAREELAISLRRHRARSAR
jgi:RNA polymerase sigma-70 factor (ECF subfamily)